MKCPKCKSERHLVFYGHTYVVCPDCGEKTKHNIMRCPDCKQEYIGKETDEIPDG